MNRMHACAVIDPQSADVPCCWAGVFVYTGDQFPGWFPAALLSAAAPPGMARRTRTRSYPAHVPGTPPTTQPSLPRSGVHPAVFHPAVEACQLVSHRGGSGIRWDGHMTECTLQFHGHAMPWWGGEEAFSRRPCAPRSMHPASHTGALHRAGPRRRPCRSFVLRAATRAFTRSPR